MAKAASKAPKNSEGVTADAAKPNPAVAGLDAAGATSEQAASLAGPDAPSLTMTTGTNSTDAPPTNGDQDGAGNSVGSAGAAEFDVDAVFDRLMSTPDPEAAFRSEFPNFAAAMDAWKADHGTSWPVAVRIRSRIDGFRRGGMVHTKEAVDHPAEGFTGGPAQMEALFSEPNLTVEFVAAE